METIVERPAALDVHKARVPACVRVPVDWLEAHLIDARRLGVSEPSGCNLVDRRPRCRDARRNPATTGKIVGAGLLHRRLAWPPCPKTHRPVGRSG